MSKKLAGWKAILEDAPYHNQEHDFGELAKAHSECPSASRGGNLGFFPKGKMVDEFDAICFNEKTRAIYGPVRTATPRGWMHRHCRRVGADGSRASLARAARSASATLSYSAKTISTS